MSNTQIELSSTNFDDIETSLIDWLKSRPEWAEYDFTIPGSASALLIDICSAIAYKQNVQSNFALNERFLNTARLRSNILRRSKELNYTTQSPVAASAILRLKFTPEGNPDFVIIPSGTRFQANGIDKTFTFTALATSTAMKEDEYVVDIEVVQGDYLTYEWTVEQNQKFFVIPNPNVDMSRLKVNVKYTSADVFWTEYTKSQNIVENDPSSTVYYEEEINGQMFRIYFGDDVISKAIVPGNIVKVDYLVTDGEDANNILSFQLLDELDYEPTVEVIQASNGGKAIEEIDSIKRYAPLGFYSQNRAVTSNDYKYIIKSRFPQISSVNAWGGEDNTPPLFGRVCVSAMTAGNYVLSDNLKNEIAAVFDDNKIIGSKRISWFDPVIIQILTNMKIFYNQSFTNEASSTLKVLVQSSLLEYQKQINEFQSTFNYSDFLSFIKSLDRSFIDVICNLALNYSYAIDDFTEQQNISLILNNALESGSLISSKYYNDTSMLVYLKDDKNGIINEYTMSDQNEVVTQFNVGTIDYSTGHINVNNLRVKALFQSDTLDIQATPVEYNVVSEYQNVFNLNPTKSQIEMVRKLVN